MTLQVQTGEFHSVLIFKKLRGHHSGVYTCTARNTAAVASHSATLLVQCPFPIQLNPFKTQQNLGEPH